MEKSLNNAAYSGLVAVREMAEFFSVVLYSGRILDLRTESGLETPKVSARKPAIVIVVIIAVVMLSVGGLVGYWVGYRSNSNRVNDLQGQLLAVQSEIEQLQREMEPINRNQTGVLEKLDVLQAQLVTIRGQIESLQSSNESSQGISRINAEIVGLQSQLISLQQQINDLRNTVSVTYQNVTYVLGETVLPQLFERVKDSVVVVQALVRRGTTLTSVQGSGFVNNFTGQMTIITCNHVVRNAISINVTFSNGNRYAASITGTNPNADVAVLMANAPQGEYKPLVIVDSSSLKVGSPVIVIGTPYGLEGSMSTGIISATNRTITVDQVTMTNMIQTTAPLNPGNSGGPLINYEGQVVGMANAIIQESQGIGLAVPANSIMQSIVEIIK